MNTKIKTILWIVLFVVFLLIAYFTYNALLNSKESNTESQIEKTSSEQEEEKIAAPDFTVFDSQGNAVKLSDFAGKPIVLNFWASWCPPCKSEMPHFNEVYADVKEDVVFLMVNLTDGQRETQSKGQAYIEDAGYDFPVYFDHELIAAYSYQIMYYPTTLFINAEGNIIIAYQGAIDKDTLLSGIQKIRN